MSFKIGRYDHHAPLVIDPVLSYSTYLAGSGGGAANGIAVDSSGDAYITGVTYSTDFPVTPGAFQSNCGGGGHPCQPTYHTNVFVSKLSSDGSKLIYSTYLGGEMSDEGNAIAVDSSGDAYVTGATQSPDFPVTAGAFQTICSQPSQGQCASAFVTKLNPSGSGLVYSTYLGGAPGSQRSDHGNAIAVDSAGDAYVGGGAGSTDFPTTTGAFQTAVVPATATLATHGFMTELNPSGSALLYSTLLGGSGGETVNGIALDASGNIYVAGATTSLDFPTTANAIEPGASNALNSSAVVYGFVVKFSPTGKVVYSSYFNAPIQGIATDSAGAAYLAGGSYGTIPTTTGAFENAFNLSFNLTAAFAAKLHPAGCALTYATYLGGNNLSGSTGTAISVDAEGDSYIVGAITGGGLPWSPVMNSLQPPALGGGLITELNPSGSAELFSTTLGGSTGDSANGVAVDAHGDVHVAGETTSNDFPVANAIQPDCVACQFNVKAGAFVAKIVPGTPTPVSLTRAELTFSASGAGTSFFGQLEAVGLMNNQATPLTISSVSVTGTAFSLAPPTSATCSGTVAANSGCLIYVQFAPQSAGGYTGTLTINDSGPGSPRTVALRGAAGEPFSVTASPQFTGNPLAGTDSVSYIVSAESLAGYSGVPGQVALTCLNSAAPATCSFSPASVAVGGQSTLTLTGLSNLNLEDSDSFGFTISATYGGQTLPVPLTIKFADFRPSSSSTSAAISAGQTATYSISYLPVNGFTGQVELTCTGAPADATCSVSPYNLSLNGTAASTVTVTVATAAPSALLPSAPPEDSGKQRLVLLEWAALLLLIFALLHRRQMQKYPFALWRRLFVLGAVALLAVGMAGCGGGGGGGGSSGGGGSPGTPAGTYTLTVTGLASEASMTLKQNISLALTVK